MGAIGEPTRQEPLQVPDPLPAEAPVHEPAPQVEPEKVPA